MADIDDFGGSSGSGLLDPEDRIEGSDQGKEGLPDAANPAETADTSQSLSTVKSFNPASTVNRFNPGLEGLLKPIDHFPTKEAKGLFKDNTATQQENTRTALAILLLLIFSASILASFVYIFASRFLPSEGLQCAQVIEAPAAEGFRAGPANSTPSGSTSSSQTRPDTAGRVCIADNGPEQLITLILNSLTTIIGTALGFYFGAKGREDLRAAEQANNSAAGQPSNR